MKFDTEDVIEKLKDKSIIINKTKKDLEEMLFLTSKLETFIRGQLKNQNN